MTTGPIACTTDSHTKIDPHIYRPLTNSPLLRTWKFPYKNTNNFLDLPRTQQQLHERRVNGITLFFGKESPLSNMFPCSFTDATNITWNCTEQYYQYHKALYFNDHRSANAIRASYNPFHIKRLGNLIQGYSQNPAGRHSWRNLHALSTLTSACKLKFSQNPHLRNYLRSHTDGIIAEANPYDSFFGIGLHLSDPRATIPTCWPGLNQMGHILMELRYELPSP